MKLAVYVVVETSSDLSSDQIKDRAHTLAELAEILYEGTCTKAQAGPLLDTPDTAEGS